MGSETTSYWAEIQQYEEILGNDPASYCFVQLAELYRKMNLLDDALAIIEKGCDRYPELVSGQLVLGKVLLDRGHTGLARKALETVVRALPDCGEALRLLGQLYMDAGEYVAARQALKIVLDLAPTDTECRLLLASLLPPQVGEQFAAAVPESHMATPAPISFVEDSEEDLEEIELIQELTDEFDEVPAAVEAVAAVSPSAPLTTVTMAELYAQQGFIERARGIYREILADEPDHVIARQRLAELETAQVSSADTSPAPSAQPVANTAPVTTAQPLASDDGTIGMLQQLLTNIGRVRAWRSKRV